MTALTSYVLTGPLHRQWTVPATGGVLAVMAASAAGLPVTVTLQSEDRGTEVVILSNVGDRVDRALDGMLSYKIEATEYPETLLYLESTQPLELTSILPAVAAGIGSAYPSGPCTPNFPNLPNPIQGPTIPATPTPDIQAVQAQDGSSRVYVYQLTSIQNASHPDGSGGNYSQWADCFLRLVIAAGLTYSIDVQGHNPNATNAVDYHFGVWPDAGVVPAASYAGWLFGETGAFISPSGDSVLYQQPSPELSTGKTILCAFMSNSSGLGAGTTVRWTVTVTIA